MTTVGEAYIAIKADMRPFTQGLRDEVEKASKNIEMNLSEAVRDGLKNLDSDGDEQGERLGAGLARGLKRRLGNKRQDPWLSVFAAMGSALDDGISALPTEVKAGIVGGLLLATPFISAGISGAVTAGLAAGFVTLGGILALQYQTVNDRGKEVLESLRVTAVEAAEPFGEEMMMALDLIEQRLTGNIGPLLRETFNIADDFVLPITEGALGGVENFLEGVNDALEDSGPFVRELAFAFRTLGTATGEALQILASTGEEGAMGLRDLTFAVGDLLITLSRLVAGLTEVYGWARKVTEGPLGFAASAALAVFRARSDEAAEASRNQTGALEGLDAAFTNTIKLTSEQEQEMRKLVTITDKYSKLTYEIVQSQIDFQAALDNITEALKANGATLDIANAEGREVAEAFLRALKESEEGIQRRLQAGEIGAQQAIEQYGREIRMIEDLAFAAGITEDEFYNLYAAIVNAATGRLDAQAMGIVAVDLELEDTVRTARELLERLQRISQFRLPSVGTRPFSEYADGGIVHGPTNAIIGEAGSEVVIPLTKPSRAAQLLQQSGLDRLMSSGPTVVYVYIGNEAVDQRMVQIVERNNTQQAQNLAFGARGI